MSEEEPAPYRVFCEWKECEERPAPPPPPRNHFEQVQARLRRLPRVGCGFRMAYYNEGWTDHSEDWWYDEPDPTVEAWKWSRPAFPLRTEILREWGCIPLSASYLDQRRPDREQHAWEPDQLARAHQIMARHWVNCDSCVWQRPCGLADRLEAVIDYVRASRGLLVPQPPEPLSPPPPLTKAKGKRKPALPKPPPLAPAGGKTRRRPNPKETLPQ